jgi:hypothetical protein
LSTFERPTATSRYSVLIECFAIIFISNFIATLMFIPSTVFATILPCLALSFLSLILPYFSILCVSLPRLDLVFTYHTLPYLTALWPLSCLSSLSIPCYSTVRKSYMRVDNLFLSSLVLVLFSSRFQSSHIHRSAINKIEFVISCIVFLKCSAN